MSTEPQRRRPPTRETSWRRSRGRGLALAAALAAVGVGGVAWAVPVEDPHVGGIGFSGPTSGDVAAVYWNPAALGLMRGLHFMVAGTAAQTTLKVSRAAGAGDARAVDRTQPFSWPLGPGGFAGLSYDVGGDRFSLAVATYMPYAERTTYEVAPAGTALPTRYHRISADLRNLALVPALSVRFAGDFRLGFAPGFLFSTGRIAFDEPVCPAGDSACPGDENASHDARYDLGSGFGLGSSSFAVTLGGGVYFRRRTLEFGAAFSSQPLGGDDTGSVAIGGDRSVVGAPGGTLLRCPGDPPDGAPTGRCVFATIVHKLPYVFTGAIAWHVRPGMELGGIVRLLSFPDNDVLDIRLTGMPLYAAGLPEHVVLHRGYSTVIDARLRWATWVGERLRIGAGLRLESAALPAEAVSPAAVDGRKLEPTAMVLASPVRHLWIGAGYAFTYMFPVTASPSIFDPAAATACTAAGGDLDACRARNIGIARPTAAGTYERSTHTFSVSLMAQF